MVYLLRVKGRHSEMAFIYYLDPRRDTRPSTSLHEHERKHESTSSKYPRPDARRDRKDRYRTSHRREEQYRSSEVPKKSSSDIICYICQEPGHYATNCPRRKEHKERRSEAKIQSVQQHPKGASPSPSPSPSSRTGSEGPTAQNLSPDSHSDSSN
jgi:hypothetical protein